MSNYSKNYSDKDAPAVKAPIADAIDRLNSSGEGAEVKTANVYFENKGNFQGLTVDIPQYLEMPDRGKVYAAGSPTIAGSGTYATVPVPCVIRLTDAAAVARIYSDSDGVEIIQGQSVTFAIVRHGEDGTPATIVFDSNE